MKNNKLLYLNLFLLSASVLCFEIISTRIASVIFVNDYAFIIVSLAMLGLGSGSIYSYYKINSTKLTGTFNVISRSLIFMGGSLLFFIVSVVVLSITIPFIFFFLLFVPFFLAGIVYAVIFKMYAEYSFKIYAADLSGGALGSIVSLGFINIVGAPNSILFLAIIIFSLSISFTQGLIGKRKMIVSSSILFILFVLLSYNGKKEFLGEVPIGNYLEKDYYHVYPNLNYQSQIIDSRWSIYGRSDLAQYSHQDVVKQLFIDGAAGTQMYRFNGNVKKPEKILLDLLIRHSISIPFLFLTEQEKNNMLIIGPGGGKEVLIGLFGGVEQITGVEINPDFVDIVEDHKNFNGGIYTDFPNVNVFVQEGRHYIKRSNGTFDLIVMALPSTEQMQSIEPFAMSENYLLTIEAIQDYLKILTPEGRLIFTVHNQWELLRLIVTTVSAFEELGVESNDMQNHFAVLEAEYAPTIVIKKNAFTQDEVSRWHDTMKKIPKELPAVTYLPYSRGNLNQTNVSLFLSTIIQNKEVMQKYIGHGEYDISPCRDDKPYFYKVNKGAPDEYWWLLCGLGGFNLFVVWLPLKFIKKKNKKEQRAALTLPLTIFICIGLGFMILEVSLFQKFILYLGSPTVSLSILLSSLLIGMGIGSIWGKKLFKDNIYKRLNTVSLLIVISGILLFILCPYVLSKLLVYSLIIRCPVSFFMILPFGLLLGIPFPSCIQLLKQGNMEKYIPWMYGVYGAMSVLGSVLAVILSMLYGFTPAFIIGLLFYFIIFILLHFTSNK